MTPRFTLTAAVLDARDPNGLARFHQRLLGWPLEVALAAGARLAEFQPQPDVRVCLDPAGHPFCLWVSG